MPRKGYLGEFEQIVLLAILQLKDTAFGAQIGDELETKARRGVSRGALYSSLDRLEKKGYVRWEVASATSERGGQARRCFAVTPTGLSALQEAHEAWEKLAEGLEDVLRRQPS